ncbi:hypothetical protein PVK06_004717 [Gossypium arboreum]|uniref:Ycf2 N-terminal domain-containing protein n=1 Tax=Gossypium arboreum TaxID=29729 RepID=A0ABR0QSU8_GOSAR|nr:hypothetical protein PVK06_004717 [Gossypium arboreum]
MPESNRGSRWWRNWIGKKRDSTCKISKETVAGIEISFKEKDIKYLEFLFVYYTDDSIRKDHDWELFDRLSPKGGNKHTWRAQYNGELYAAFGKDESLPERNLLILSQLSGISLKAKKASQKVTEACKGFLGPDGDWPSSAKEEGSLTARPTGRAGTKVGLSDPTVPSGRAVAQRIKVTLGITG